MFDIFPLKYKGKIASNPHFWVIVAITLFVIFIYQAWPWKDWKFEHGVWQWFFWLNPLYKLAIFEVGHRIVGLLFFAPIIYAAVFFSWRGALAVSLASLVTVLPIILDMWPVSALITNIVVLLLPFLAISLATFELEWRRKERRIFAEREEERLAYIAKILEAQEEERQRISRDLHDETIQTLLAIANNAETMVSSDDFDSTKVSEKAARIRDEILSMTESLRDISLKLRPIILDTLGLVPALRWMVDCMNGEGDVKNWIVVKGVMRKLSSQVEVVMFRVAQEALNNIKHHANASKAVITLHFSDEYLEVVIEDDGMGFNPPAKLSWLAAHGKLGLIGMAERIKLIGGTFRIRSKPGEGTQLAIKVKC